MAVLRKLSAANIAGFFEKASRLLWELAGIALTPKEIQLKSEAIGRILQELRHENCQKFLEGQVLDSPPNPPDLLVVSADGGRVQTIHKDPQKKWKESKVGVVYRTFPAPEKPGEPYHGPSPLVKTYVATMQEWETMGDFLSQEAAQRGYEHARQTLFLGDGAAGVKGVWSRCFCDAQFILDWAHAVEHLHACAIAAFGNTQKAQDWYEHQKKSLWEGKSHLILRALRKESKRLGRPRNAANENDPRLILARNIRYVTENQPHMDYPRYRKNGWPIGSGVVEGGVKQLGKRVKGAEKHWSLPGVEAILNLMTLLLAEDNRWDHFWKHHNFNIPSKKLAA